MPLYFEWRDNPGDTAYQVLPDSISDWGNYIELGVNCPVCTALQGVAEGRAIARTGATFANPNRESTPFRDSVGVAALVNGEFVDFKWTLVDRRPFDLFGGLPPYLLSKPLSFAALPFGKAPPGVRFVWNFDDHSAPVTVVADSTVSHTFNDPAIHNVTVEMRDASGKKLALATRGFFVESKLVLVALPGLVDSTYRLIARGVLPSPTIKFTWTFGDGSPALNTSDTVVTHRFSKPGNYRVTVKAGNPADFDQDQKFVRIYPGEWRISNLTLIKSVPTKLGWLAGANRAFNDSLTYYLQRLEQNPSDGMLFFADDSLWREHGMYFQIARPGTGGSLVYWGSGSQVWMVARESSVQFSSFSNSGTLWDGSINGVGYVTLFSWPTFTFQGEFQNFISATKTGNTLRGTLRFTLYDGTSSPPERAYTFVAQLVP
jgi:PKD repeat protein